jgi:hypothetical protein
MKIFVNEKEVTPVKYEDYFFKEMLGEKNGCLAGCRTGVLIYTQEECRQGGVHDDQEGFLCFPAVEVLWLGARSFL